MKLATWNVNSQGSIDASAEMDGGSGTLIYEKLVEMVRRRGAGGRAVQTVNLGLEPAEGRALGLAAEPVSRGTTRMM